MLLQLSEGGLQQAGSRETGEAAPWTEGGHKSCFAGLTCSGLKMEAVEQCPVL